MALSEQELIEAGLAIGIITQDQLEDARLEARRQRAPLLRTVSRLARQPIPAFYQALAQSRNLPYLHPSHLNADPDDLEKMPKGLMVRRQCLPVRPRGGDLFLVMANPDDLSSLEQISLALGVDLKPAMAFPEALAGAIERAQGEEASESFGAADASVLLDDILTDAFMENASDIHLQPIENHLRVRYRVDGRLRDWRRDLRPAECDPIVNRIKVLSDLDIAESRAPQDGSFRHTFEDFDNALIELRVSTLPVNGGERVVMRLLGANSNVLQLANLGLGEEVEAQFAGSIRKPHGVLLVTGPTGSGKSTTLYAALREIDRNTRNVITVEDPIEQIVEGTSQVQISVKIGFSDALRSILRQDPDVILIGEIRDGETADIALKAAQTGHLVFSTLHTNTAIGAITRLVDLGVGRWQIAASLNGVMSQRLVPTLCPRCRRARAASPAENRALMRAETCADPIYDPVGCPFCLGTGYRGRVGVFETIWIDEALRDLIASGASEADMLRATQSYTPLQADLIRKVISGQTSFAAAQDLGLQL